MRIPEYAGAMFTQMRTSMKKGMLFLLICLMVAASFTGCGKSEKVSSGKNQSAKLASTDDLKDKRIGVLLGSVHDTYATKSYPLATVLQYKSPSDMILAVKSGKIDAAVYTLETLLEIIREDSELALLGKPLFSVSIGMGFNKNNDDLRNKFNRFLKQIKENGVYA